MVGALTKELYADVVRPEGDRMGNVSAAAPLFSSFKRDALRGAPGNRPRHSARIPLRRNSRGLARGSEELRCVALHCNHRRITKEFVEEVKDLGYWMFCYTVNDPARAQEILRWASTAFCTDRLDLVRPYL